MSINYNRNRVQTKYERLIGITTPEELKDRKEDFKNRLLTESDVLTLLPEAKLDALDFFNNAVISLSEGIDAIYLRRFSWATVKLYYAIYYLLRASLAAKKYVLMRNQSMFRLKLKAGEKPYNTRNRKFNATHGGTIAHYVDIYSNADILLSNKIGERNVYEWMEHARDVINYLDVSFRDPQTLKIWDKFREAAENRQLTSLLSRIQNDNDYIYCFQEDFAVVAIPIKRLQLTIVDMYSCGYLSSPSNDRFNYYDTILKQDERGLHILDNL